MPQVLTSILYTVYICAHMQSQVARTQTDRILRTLRTTRPTRHLHDRAEPPVSIPCSMAAPVQRQGERSLQMCSLTRAHPKRQQLTAHRAAEPPAVTQHAEKIAHALLLVVVELDPGAQRSSRRSERPSDCPPSHHGDDMRRLRWVEK